MNIQETRLARAFTVGIDSRLCKTEFLAFGGSQASSYTRANADNWDGFVECRRL